MNHPIISFYPGPSRVHDEIPSWVKEAHRLDVLSMNHRSKEFVAITSRTTKLFRQKLRLPADYRLYFVSSATECWEIIAQSLVKDSSMHIYNGAFGEKWFEYTHRIRPQAKKLTFPAQIPLNEKGLVFPGADVICLTQNETSNGTQVSLEKISVIKKSNPGALIAVDATSSMGGLALDFTTGDIWFASVQKCFGLPAGLAVMCCSPKAHDRMNLIRESAHYNSLMFIDKMMDMGQTPFTPNVLGIYLLMKALEKMKTIRLTERNLIRRFKQYDSLLSLPGNRLQPFIADPHLRSYTVIVVSANDKIIEEVKRGAKIKDMLLGDGYGALRASTLRIANFPAIKDLEINKLQRYLENMLPYKVPTR